MSGAKVTKRNMIGITAIREKASELDLAQEDLLSVYLLEQLALRLAESERGDRLLLKNPAVFRLVRRGHERRLQYAYLCEDGEQLTKADFSLFLKRSVKWERKSNIDWSFRTRMEGSRLIVELESELEGVRLPLLLVVDPIDRSGWKHEPGSYSLRLLMEADKTKQIARYPLEEQLLDDLCIVLSQLELIRDMRPYERIYEALGLLAVEGRPMQKKLSEACSRQQLALDEARFAQMERYRSYPLMIKKWKAFKKKQAGELPEWEQVYGLLWSFLEPLWSACLQDMIYLGSWIPDLGRYLD